MASSERCDAAGFQLYAQEASGLGSAFAGQVALADDASTVFTNPAGMGRLVTPDQVASSFQYFSSTTRFSDQGSCTPYLGTAAGSASCPFGRDGNLGHSAKGEGRRSPVSALIPTGYASMALIPGALWAGIALNAPFGLETDYGRDWVGRFGAIGSKVSAININPAIAWKPVEAVVLGAGVSAQRFDARLSSAVSYRAVALGSGVSQLIAAVPAGTEGVSTLRGDDWGFGWNVGVSGSAASDRLRFGASFRSSVRHRLDGSLDFSDRPAALAGVPQLQDGGVRLGIRLPATVAAGIEWKVADDVSALASWSRTKWSVIQNLDVVRTDGLLAGTTAKTIALSLQDTNRYELGAIWRVTPQWTLRAGVARDGSSVADAYRTPILPDTKRTEFAVGTRVALGGGFTLDVGATIVKPENPGVVVPNQATPASAPTGSLVGTVATRVVVVAAQIGKAF